MSQATRDERALRRVFASEAWASERIINLLRILVFLPVGLVELYLRGNAGCDPHTTAMPWLMIGWGTALAMINFTLMRRTYRSWFAVVFTAIDVLVITAAITIVYRHNVEVHADTATAIAEAAKEVDRGRLGLLLVLVANMVRFSWKVTAFTAAIVCGALIYLRSITNTLDGFSQADGVMLLGFLGLLLYTTRRFRNVLRRQSLELRTMQRQRLSALRALIAGISHEFNSPLGALKANADTTGMATKRISARLEQNDDAKAQRALKALNAAADGNADAVARISEVVTTLQQFARLDQAETKGLKLRDALQTCKRMVSHRLGPNITLTIDCPEQSEIVGQPADLNQLFMQLFENALNAIGDQGEVHVEVKSAPDIESITVRDNGKGMPAGVIQAVTEPHFAGESGRTKLGLGLTTVRSVVDEHDGTMQIESQPGKGTAVTISLPRTR